MIKRTMNVMSCPELAKFIEPWEQRREAADPGSLRWQRLTLIIDAIEEHVAFKAWLRDEGRKEIEEQRAKSRLP